MAAITSGRYTFANDTLTTQNIAFKSGLQTNLNTLISNGGAVEGTFYLTTDTHRLYIGRTITQDGSTAANITIPIPVNEGIQTVTNVSDLSNVDANAGEFYYASGDNILCIYNGSNWVQINPDTNTQVKTTSVSIVKNKTSSTNSNLVYDVTITQQEFNGSNVIPNTQTTATTSFTIDASAIANLVSVGVSASAPSSNSTTISTTGSNASSDDFTLTAQTGITLTGSKDALTLTGTTYTLASEGNDNTNTKIVLTDSNTQTQGTINVAGSNKINVSNASNTITVKHDAQTFAAGTSGTEYGTNTSGTISGAIKVPKITADQYGHISSIGETSLTLPSVVTIDRVTANNDGQIVITKSDTTSIDSGANSVLYHTLTIDGTTHTINNQGDLGAFLSPTEIDNRIEAAVQGINALVYKGTIGTNDSTIGSSTLPTSNVAIGDTYLVNAGTTITGAIDGASSKSCHIGDLLIATGTEGSDGFISSNLSWTHVAAGDIDTTYTLSGGTGTNPAYTLMESTGNGTSKGSVQIEGGTAITATGSPGTGAGSYKVTISHNNSTVSAGVYGSSSGSGANITIDATPTTLDAGNSFTVPSIKVDAQGHVTNAGTKTYTLPASNNDEYTLKNTADNSTYDAVLRLLKNSSVANSITLGTNDTGNSGLQVSATSNNIKFSHRTVTQSDTSPSSTISNGSFTAITGVTRDSYGHITGIATTNYTIPTTAYTLSNEYTSANNQVKTTLLAGTSSVGSVQYSSSTLTVNEVPNNSNAYTVDLVWGSF